MTLFRLWRIREGQNARSMRDLEGRINGVGFLAGGTATDSGDAITTAFTIAHNLGTTPTLVSVTPASSAAGADFHVTVDASDITVTYGAAPASGSSNLTWWWAAGFTGG